MRKVIRCRFLVYLFMGIICMFGTLVQEAGAATTFNVGASGDFSTIQGCIDAAVAGDTCLVEPDIYPENLIITKGITLRSTDGAASTFIDGTNSGRVVHIRGFVDAGVLLGVVLDGFTITNGSAPDGLGGGIYIEHSVEPLITNCVITGNSALSGGGIALFDGPIIRVVDSSVTGNNATGALNSGIELNCDAPPYSFTLEGGGGISLHCSSTVFTVRSDISDNSAVGNGGGIRARASLISNQQSDVTGNTSLASGGGVYTAENTGYINHTNVIAGNTANTGGGIYATSGNAIDIINSTIFNNMADAGGGFYAEPGRLVRSVNTILYGNSSPPVFSSNTCIAYSNIEGGFPGEGNISEDCFLLGNGDLNSDSPCIDAATSDASICGGSFPVIPLDIVGRPRPVAGIYDMGAYEYSMPGDCNSDGTVDAGDISAVVLEIFDDDGTLPADTAGSTFAGNPVGCNANEDGIVDAGDISCTVLLIFNGPGSCGAPASASPMSASYQAASTGPGLDIPVLIEPNPDGTVTVPVNYTSNGNDISAIVLSVDYDETLLSFDPSDNNGDTIPDSITFNINPNVFFPGITFDGGDTDGELDFVIADISAPLASLPDGTLVEISFTVLPGPAQTEASVNFSQNPGASFGDTSGLEVIGTVLNGSVLIPAEDMCSQYAKRRDCNSDPNCEWVGSSKNGTCQAIAPCTPTSPDEVGLCGDGIDNDCDGVTDCADTADCATDPVCQQSDCSVNTDRVSCEADPDCRWKKKQQVCVNR